MDGYPSENAWISEVIYNRIIENKRNKMKKNPTLKKLIGPKIIAEIQITALKLLPKQVEVVNLIVMSKEAFPITPSKWAMSVCFAL